MTSVLNVDTIADKAGTGPVGLTKQHALKAWILGETDASLLGSFNTASGTDQGTGDFQYSFTNSMSDANYAVSTVGTAQNNAEHVYNPARATGTVDINVFDGSAVRDRRQGVHIAGDLA
jgi:hypothetical protein